LTDLDEALSMDTAAKRNLEFKNVKERVSENAKEFKETFTGDCRWWLGRTFASTVVVTCTLLHHAIRPSLARVSYFL
jgi:hypothetical protein